MTRQNHGKYKSSMGTRLVQTNLSFVIFKVSSKLSRSIFVWFLRRSFALNGNWKQLKTPSIPIRYLRWLCENFFIQQHKKSVTLTANLSSFPSSS